MALGMGEVDGGLARIMKDLFQLLAVAHHTSANISSEDLLVRQIAQYPPPARSSVCFVCAFLAVR